MFQNIDMYGNLPVEFEYHNKNLVERSESSAKLKKYNFLGSFVQTSGNIKWKISNFRDISLSDFKNNVIFELSGVQSYGNDTKIGSIDQFRKRGCPNPPSNLPLLSAIGFGDCLLGLKNLL